MTEREIIAEHVHTHAERVGFSAPESLEYYLVDLLTSRIRQTQIIPEPSFAERYLQLYDTKTRPSEIREYADQCLFFTGLLPEYGHRRGLDVDYYASLGISSYYTVGDITEDDRMIQLGNWFYHLQKFLNSALHPDTKLELININVRY